MDDRRDEYWTDSDDEQKYDPYAEFEKRRQREEDQEDLYEEEYEASDDSEDYDDYEEYIEYRDEEVRYDRYSSEENFSDERDEEDEEEEKYDAYKRFEENDEDEEEPLDETEAFTYSDDEYYREEYEIPEEDPERAGEEFYGESPEIMQRSREGSNIAQRGKGKKKSGSRKKKGKKASGNGGGRKRKKRRTTRKFRRTVTLILFILFMIAGIYLFLTSSIFAISEISVQNNVMQSDQEIIRQSGIKKGTNIFKCQESKIKKAVENGNSYITDVTISRQLPNRLVITVKEKTPFVALKYRGKFLILDKKGYVVGVEKTQIIATRLIGIRVKSYEKGKKPSVKNQYALQQGLKLIRKVNESGLFFKKVDVSSTLIVTGYITDDLKCTGKIEDITDNLEGIKAVVYDLGQKDTLSGTINVGSDGFATFGDDDGIESEEDSTGSTSMSSTEKSSTSTSQSGTDEEDE